MKNHDHSQSNSMFCFQCAEAIKGEGCSTLKGACGKSENVALLQDVLIFIVKGVSLYAEKGIEESNSVDERVEQFVTESLFSTITNANFDDERFYKLIDKGFKLRDELRLRYGASFQEGHLDESLTWSSTNREEILKKAFDVGIQSTKDADIRSLRELLIYGIKGMAAYAHHAHILGYHDPEICKFMIKGLASTTKDLNLETMLGLVMEAGKVAVTTMALLDKANTETYGNPEITKVKLGVGTRPGILVSGHDLKDLADLLEQTKDKGIDIYTHSEMLPAHYYPKFKTYTHFFGNYGNAWWDQNRDFENFNGPILMTTNCIIPVRDSYRNRIFTTGSVGYPGITHLTATNELGQKDFSAIIELAQKSVPPKEIENGTIVGGFAHHQVLALADKVIDAVKSGAIKKFVVMAGCDGRHPKREYYTNVAKILPSDTVILTAGCAKYRYNKLDLGNIGGIPRVLDAGQCNDSYSLAIIAMKLKEVFALNDINDLPICYDIAWYEQKAVTVLLALLYLGVKNIKLGPNLPAFLSPNVVSILSEKFNIMPISSAEEDVKCMIG